MCIYVGPLYTYTYAHCINMNRNYIVLYVWDLCIYKCHLCAVKYALGAWTTTEEYTINKHIEVHPVDGSTEGTLATRDVLDSA